MICRTFIIECRYLECVSGFEERVFVRRHDENEFSQLVRNLRSILQHVPRLWLRTSIILFTFGVCGGSALPALADSSTCTAHVQLSLQSENRVALDQPISVALEPEPGQTANPADLEFVTDTNFDVTPKVVHLSAGVSTQIKIVLKTANAGLIHLVARVRAWPPTCRTALDLPLDVGLRQVAHLETSIQELRPDSTLANKGDVPQIDGDTIESFKIELRDSSEHPVEVGAPITVLLQSNLPVLSEDGKTWKTDAKAFIPQDHDSTGYIYFHSPRTAVARGAIDVHLKKDSGAVDLMTEELVYSSRHVWWIYFLITLAGALGYSLVEALLNSDKDITVFAQKLFEGYGFKLLVAVVVGAIGYLLREASVLGIKVDTSNARGYAVLGFLFACLGLEAIFKKIRDTLGRNV
jgi:hypothetical protein